MGESQWIVSVEELRSIPPSLKTMSWEEELQDRRTATVFIDRLGHALGLPQLSIATAQVFLHRFYLRESFKKYNLHEMALTMVFLGAKTEESPRKLRDILLQGIAVRFKTTDGLSGFMEGSPDYCRVYDRVLTLEKLALAVLCFDLAVDHPYRHLARLFHSHPDRFTEPLTKDVWAVLTRSYETPLCLLFPPRVIALALLLYQMHGPSALAAASQLPTLVGCDRWDEAFPVVSEDHVRAALHFLLHNCPFSLSLQTLS